MESDKPGQHGSFQVIVRQNGSPPGSDPGKAEAERLFEELATELEEGHYDPEAFFASHPDSERELRELYRGWRRVDVLFRDIASAESVVGAVRQDFEAEVEAKQLDTLLSRLAVSGFDQHYELGDELGHGGMGVVRRVTDRVLGRELAMKVVRPVEPGRRARLLRRFLEEAEVIGRLEHPGIVPIHELGLDSEGQVYFTMPLVHGRTLQEILRLAREEQEGWTLTRVLEVLLKACDAVAYAHSRGVLHRDLKPANVMVGRFGEVYVMDWGLARSLGAPDRRGGGAGAEDGALTLVGEVLGTPAYMAPEQALGRSEGLDERCDVYALGAILYDALAGVRPYGECSSAEALALLGREPPQRIEKLARGASEELCAIVGRAMVREREERYPSVAALAADLRAFLEGRVVQAHRTGPWVEAKKWVLRNRGLALALTAAVTVLMVGLAATIVLFRREARERANVFRLAQTRTLANLVERADRLWPAHPDKITEMHAWQADARALVRTLDPDPASGDPGLRAHLAALAARRDTWNEEDRWWHEELGKLVASIGELADSELGLLGEGAGPHGFGIGHRLGLAERLRTESERADVLAGWEELLADMRADPRFAGVELRPIVGLVPLGRDPASGLWELAHTPTGAVPTRGADGRLALAPDTALVFVLLPRGEFLMGAQDSDPAGPHYVPHPQGEWAPLARASAGPVLLSKYEMTQGQWQRGTGTNPSFHAKLPDASRLPVEQVSWLAAHEELARLGLRLPTEAEWEYACRAGTDTRYSWGDDPAAFARHANVRDVTLQELFQHPHDAFEPQSDGFPQIAPSGSFLPNPWGLHDFHGNVFEWCADLLAPGFEGPASRVFRGGSYQRLLLEALPSFRRSERPEYVYRSIGVRPACDLDSGALSRVYK